MSANDPPPLARTVAAPPPGTFHVPAPATAATLPGPSPLAVAASVARLATPPAAIGGYAVLRELGRGGMGAVYEVRDPAHPERALALKVILDESNTQALARFEREAQVMARVRHPGVVQVHQLGRAPEGPFIVTDLVHGETLERAAARGIEPDRAAVIVRAVADALAAIHAQGIVHRDLKPQNIILRADDGKPVLLDFGIARDRTGERLTATGALLGSPAYMSPEQASGKSPESLDGRTDVYGAGAILFELLAGRPPHDGAALMDVLKKVQTEDPRWPSLDRPATPPGLEAVCRMAMARGRMFRYPDAAALRDDLDRFLAGERPQALERFTPRRRPPFAALAAGALALALTLGVAAWAASEGEGAAKASPATASVAPAPSAAAPPPRVTWADRVAAASRAPWPVKGHLVLRHVEHLPTERTHMVRAAFLDDERVVTFGPDRAHARWTVRTWTLAPEGAQPSTPDAEVALPVIPGSPFDGWVELVTGGGRAFVIARHQGAALLLSPDGRTLERLPTPHVEGESLCAVLAVEGESLIFAPHRMVAGALVSRVARVDRAGHVEELFALPDLVADLQVRDGYLAATSSRMILDDPTSMGAGALVVWDLARGVERYRGELALGTSAMALLPGDRVAVGLSGGFIHVVDLATREARSLAAGDDFTHAGVKGASFGVSAPSAHASGITGLVVAPDGTLWSTSGCSCDFEARPMLDGELRAWRDAATPLVALTRPARGWQTGADPQARLHGAASLAIAPGGSALVVGGDEGEAHVWILPSSP